jgi:hypothetical protein
LGVLFVAGVVVDDAVDAAAAVVVAADVVGMLWGLGFLKGGRCFGW